MFIQNLLHFSSSTYSMKSFRGNSAKNFFRNSSRYWCGHFFKNYLLNFKKLLEAMLHGFLQDVLTKPPPKISSSFSKTFSECSFRSFSKGFSGNFLWSSYRNYLRCFKSSKESQQVLKRFNFLLEFFKDFRQRFLKIFFLHLLNNVFRELLHEYHKDFLQQFFQVFFIPSRENLSIIVEFF